MKTKREIALENDIVEAVSLLKKLANMLKDENAFDGGRSLNADKLDEMIDVCEMAMATLDFQPSRGEYTYRD